MAGPELLLDSSIRLWVVLPIVFITFFVGVIRHYVTQLLHSEKKVELEQVSDSGMLLWFLFQSFAMRKHYFNDPETGFFKKTKRKVVPKNPMTAKVPFPLTLRFKPMLQRGIELLSLDASWYATFTSLLGRLKSCCSLLQAADQSRIMQDQMTGAVMAMPPDPNKAFKAEWEALEIVDHQWALENIEDELIARDLNFEGIFDKELKRPMF
ncbi:EMC3 protein, partial [Polypterus senegalus]